MHCSDCSLAPSHWYITAFYIISQPTEAGWRVSNLAIIGSDNSLSPGRHQVIVWTNAGILLSGPLGTKFNEILFIIHTISFKKIHLKMSTGKWQPLCLSLHVMTIKWCNQLKKLTVNENKSTLDQLESKSIPDLLSQFRDICAIFQQLLLAIQIRATYDIHLTLVVLKLESSGRTLSLSWLLMPWLLASPGHQQQQYSIHRINRSFLPKGTIPVRINLTHQTPPFHRHFQMHFRPWKVLCFDSNFNEVCSQGSK